MAYGNLLTDVVQSSTTNTPPVFKDGNGTQVGTLCRAWVNFDGSAVIRGSFNVSSVTRTTTGRFTVTFATAMPDTAYAAQATADFLGGYSVNASVNDYAYGSSQTTTSCGIFTRGHDGSDQNPNGVFVAVFR